MSLFDLSGRVFIITGSSRGIGLAAAEELAANGGKVVISSRKADACKVAVRQLQERFGTDCAISIPTNISNKDDLEALVDGTISHYGRLDGVVCNAASNPFYGPMAEIPDALFLKVLQNNIISNHWLIRHAVPHLEKADAAAIVIISSIGALHGSASIGAYNISKAADLQMGRNLAVELGPRGIRINCVAPGVIRTDFARALWEKEEQAALLRKITPLGRPGDPEDISGVISFLLSPASRFMTGQCIVADGGMTIAGPAL